MLLPVHIAAGGLAIILGAVALIAAKGGTVHRKAGILFVYAMLIMGFSASVLALPDGSTGNLLGGFLCAYFVITALTTVRPPSDWARRSTIIALVGAVALALVHLALAYRAFASPRWALGGVPAPMFLFLGTILSLGAAGDVRVLTRGPLKGRQRLSRHLWRMCFALFIAAGSFFSIRARVARVLPEPFTTPMMRALPIILVFTAMFYWLWRLRARRTLALAR